MKARLALFTGGLLILFVSPSLGAPSCFGDAIISRAEIRSVETTGTMTLADGHTVKLEGLRLTAQGAALLRQTTAGHAIAIHTTAPAQDRYGRLRAHIELSDGVWLQQQLLESGFARVDMAPDKADCAAKLYAAETRARATGAGLWKLPGNAVRGTALAKADTGTFQIVEGKVLEVEIRNGRAYLNFGSDYKTDFTVTISPEDRKAFWADANPRNYLGRTVRVRGIVQYYNGPELEVAAPHQIEIVQ
jgi:hypothetical protein